MLPQSYGKCYHSNQSFQCLLRLPFQPRFQMLSKASNVNQGSLINHINQELIKYKDILHMVEYMCFTGKKHLSIISDTNWERYKLKRFIPSHIYVYSYVNGKRHGEMVLPSEWNIYSTIPKREHGFLFIHIEQGYVFDNDGYI